MSRRGETRARILAYLKVERSLGPMQRYMFERHGIQAGAVREQVSRLVKAGAIERIARGRYRRVQAS
jgi:predicted transcriptional regulator